MRNKGVLLLLFIFIARTSFAQRNGWQYLDFKKDTILGISLEKAYSELLRNKQAQTIIVAIVDSGIDTLHEDLKSVLWTNSVTRDHGRNYLAGERGREDITNLTLLKKTFYDSLSYTIVPDV